MRSRQIVTWIGGFALVGCASVDPAADIDASRDLLAQRGTPPPQWTSPPGAPPWSGATLSADEAVSIALERNPEMRRAVTSIASARAALAQADTPPNPMANLTIGLPIDGTVGTMVTAAAMQQIAWLWTRPPRVDAEEARLRAAILAVTDRAVGLAAQVRERHVEVVAAEASVAAARGAVDAAAAVARATEALVQNGELSRSARFASDERLTLARRAVSQAERELDVARVQLLEAMGCGDATQVWASDGDWPAIERGDETLDAIVAAALARRLDVAAADARVLAADADARAAGASRLSNVSIGAEYERMSDGETTLGPSLAFEVPLFDRGDARIAASVAALEDARWAAQAARQSAASEAQRAARSLRTALEQWQEGSEAARRAAEARVAALRSAHGAGLASTAELSDAERMLAERTIESIADHRAAAGAAIALQRSLVGGAP